MFISLRKNFLTIIFLVFSVSMVLSCSDSGISTITRPDNSVSAPADLQVTGTAFNLVKLSWSGVTGATGYNIYISSTGTTGSFTKDGTNYSDSDTTDTILALDPSTTYYFAVTALSNGTESSYSNIVSGTTASGITAPINLEATYTTSSSIDIKWDDLSGAKGYRIYVSTVSTTGPFSLVNSSSLRDDNTYTLYGANPAQTVYIAVTAVDFSNNEGPKCTAITSTTAGISTTISAPVNLQVTATTSGSISLSWDKVTAAAGYNIYQSLTGDVDTFYLVNTTLWSSMNNSVTITGYNSGTTRYFQVSAVDAALNETLPGNIVSDTTD